jgi:ParB family transcriptional regulator, chromosome partitioning protein
MHPADQYEAFAKLHDEQGMTADDIAARFGLTPAVVRQRLKLGAVSPALLRVYRDGGMNLEQLMAFTITDDHAAQERVWLELSWNKGRDMIRHLLTQGQVPANDRRAVFVGIEAYEAAGGVVVRDLFDEAHGGFFADTVLLDRLVLEKLDAAAHAVTAEGWKWMAVAPEFNYSLSAGMRRVYPNPLPLSDEGQARLDALEAEYEALSVQHDGETATPEIEAEFDRLEAEIDALRGREAYQPDDIGRAGVFVSLGHDGAIRIERGFVRPEDEPVVERPADAAEPTAAEGMESVSGKIEPEAAESETATALSDKLVEDLTYHRTAALQDRLAGDPAMALAAVVHALAVRTFYGAGHNPHSCLKVEPAVVMFGNGIADGKAAQAVAARHDQWARKLPKAGADLWDWIVAQDGEARLSLLAYCAARTVYAVQQPWSSEPKRLAHADKLAAAVGLDMVEYWRPTVDSYLGRVTKARIIEAVREGVSDRDAESLANLKKAEMASHAERLLADKRWVPAVLRTPEPVEHSRTASTEPGQPAEIAAE